MIRNKYLILGACLLVILTGCGKTTKAEETTTTPSYTDATTFTFTCYGDLIKYKVEGDEGIQSATDTQLVILPDKGKSDKITVDYIQGNSLNDYGAAYREGLDDDSKSVYKDSSFSTDSNFYTFIRTEKNSFLMIKGPIGLEDYCVKLKNRLQ